MAKGADEAQPVTRRRWFEAIARYTLEPDKVIAGPHWDTNETAALEKVYSELDERYLNRSVLGLPVPPFEVFVRRVYYYDWKKVIG